MQELEHFPPMATNVAVNILLQNSNRARMVAVIGTLQPNAGQFCVQGLVTKVTAGNWWTHKCGFAGARGSHDCNHALRRTHTRDILEDCQTAVTAAANSESQILKTNLAGVAVDGQAGSVRLAWRSWRRHGCDLPHSTPGCGPLLHSLWPIKRCTWTG